MCSPESGGGDQCQSQELGHRHGPSPHGWRSALPASLWYRTPGPPFFGGHCVVAVSTDCGFPCPRAAAVAAAERCLLGTWDPPQVFPLNVTKQGGGRRAASQSPPALPLPSHPWKTMSGAKRMKAHLSHCPRPCARDSLGPRQAHEVLSQIPPRETKCGLPFVCSRDCQQALSLFLIRPLSPGAGERRRAGDSLLWGRGCRQAPSFTAEPRRLCALRPRAKRLFIARASSRADSESGA